MRLGSTVYRDATDGHMEPEPCFRCADVEALETPSSAITAVLSGLIHSEKPFIILFPLLPSMLDRPSIATVEQI